jgi:hypothetical protein
MILEILELEINDNTKARKMDGVTDSLMIKNDKPPLNSQYETYQLIKKLRNLKKN